MPDRYRPVIPLVRSGYFRGFDGRIRSDVEATPTVTLSAVSTGPRSLRVTFGQALVRTPVLALPGAWSVRRIDGSEMIVVSVTLEPGTGPVTYADLTTQFEQSSGTDNVVELFSAEVA